MPSADVRIPLLPRSRHSCLVTIQFPVRFSHRAPSLHYAGASGPTLRQNRKNLNLPANAQCLNSLEQEIALAGFRRFWIEALLRSHSC